MMKKEARKVGGCWYRGNRPLFLQAPRQGPKYFRGWLIRRNIQERRFEVDYSRKVSFTAGDLANLVKGGAA